MIYYNILSYAITSYNIYYQGLIINISPGQRGFRGLGPISRGLVQNLSPKAPEPLAFLGGLESEHSLPIQA